MTQRISDLASEPATRDSEHESEARISDESTPGWCSSGMCYFTVYSDAGPSQQPAAPAYLFFCGVASSRIEDGG